MLDDRFLCEPLAYSITKIVLLQRIVGLTSQFNNPTH